MGLLVNVIPIMAFFFIGNTRLVSNSLLRSGVLADVIFLSLLGP